MSWLTNARSGVHHALPCSARESILAEHRRPAMIARPRTGHIRHCMGALVTASHIIRRSGMTYCALGVSPSEFLVRIKHIPVARSLHRHAVPLITVCRFSPWYHQAVRLGDGQERSLVKCKKRCRRGGNKRKMMEEARHTCGPRPSQYGTSRGTRCKSPYGSGLE